MTRPGPGSGSAGAGPSRSTIIGTAILLSFFVGVLLLMVFAFGRIYDAYESVEDHLERALRSFLAGEVSAAGLSSDMEAALALLERLERVATKVDIRADVDRLAELWSARASGSAVSASEADRLVEALDLLEVHLAESRSSLARSYFSLIGALALCLILSLLVGLALWLRLRLSIVEAEWSQRSLKSSLAAEEEVRRRIARDLHDDAAQDIAAARMLCERAALAEFGEAARDRAAEAAALLGGAGRKLRTLAWDLRPPELERSGLLSALESLCARSRDGRGREVVFRREAESPAVSDEAGIQVYRIVQEAIANALKHAPGHRIEVSVGPGREAGRRGFAITMRDRADASAAVPGLASARIDEASSSGMGLAIMRERASILGASLSIDEGEEGYELRLFVPAAQRAGE